MYSIISCFYERVKCTPQEEKSANTYATIAQRIVVIKDTKSMNIGQKWLLVTIKPKNKYKFKAMEEAKVCLHKSLLPKLEKGPN